MIDARIVEGSLLHRADAKLLEAFEKDWPANADRYWRGEMTGSPVPEIIALGTVYFPGWQASPFGLFGATGQPASMIEAPSSQTERAGPVVRFAIQAANVKGPGLITRDL